MLLLTLDIHSKNSEGCLLMEAYASTMRWSREYDGTSFDGVLPRLIEPEILLPSQQFDRFGGRSILEGERRLMLAVLEDAVSCFQKYAGATRPRSRRLFKEAEEWFFDEEASWIFSFDSVCTVLGIHPEYFRRNLLRWKEQQLSQPPEARRRVARVRLRAARRHKILPFVPRRRNKAAKVAKAA
jgi:hypothetical protein